MEFTKEQLIRRAHLTVSRGARELEKHPDRDGVAADIKIASIAARALMAEPIYQLWDEGYYDTEKEIYDAALKAGGRGRIVYTAPPAPVSVPDELTREEYKRRFMEDDNFDDTFRGGWNACRAAMLQGAEPVSNRDELPDGWVAVPVEPTMSQEFAGYRTLTDTGKMSRLMKTRLSNIYRAMIAAAPQQEVKL
ncbi:hypothetical protein [Enterobacter quasiroggenkampii]|uniref:hypothetical protein n=1 Tax=Enterobacter quasiroggenkampii TaxID=2497436 RepID=UPI0021D3C1CF|nr:hypothetical protein [Enterobacter quasiroggenkampii]MCU6407869.1 hypothetical protein [Enterobacter quasiroggenkampii]